MDGERLSGRVRWTARHMLSGPRAFSPLEAEEAKGKYEESDFLSLCRSLGACCTSMSKLHEYCTRVQCVRLGKRLTIIGLLT